MRETEEDDLFDARLRAALSAPNAQPNSAEGGSRVLVGVTVCAAALVLWMSWQASPGSAGGQSEEQEVLVKVEVEAQDRDLAAVPIADLVKRARSEKSRRGALQELVRRGKPGAEAMAARLARVDPDARADETRAILHALAGMGPVGAVVVPDLKVHVATWSVEPVADLLATLAELAPWADANIPGGRLTFDSVEIAGRKHATTEAGSPDRFFAVFGRLRHRSKVRGKTSEAELRKLLRDKSPQCREAALDVLAYRATLPDSLVPSLASILTEDQPTISGAKWLNRQSVQTLKLPSEPVLRKKAAALLVARAPTRPESVSAFAWQLRQEDLGTAVRRRAALAIGQAKRTDRGRTSHAVDALIAAAEGTDLVVAGEAVTVLGMLGKPAVRSLEVLESLAKHADPSLAKRATAALRSMRRAVLEK